MHVGIIVDSHGLLPSSHAGGSLHQGSLMSAAPASLENSSRWRVTRPDVSVRVASVCMLSVGARLLQQHENRRKLAPRLLGQMRAKNKKEDEDDNMGGKMKNWIDRKKSEASGGAGGALVGGMLLGPLGAVVGAQVGTKLMPEVDKVLKGLEKDVDEVEAEKPSDAIRSDGLTATKESAPQVVLPARESPKVTPERVRSAPQPPAPLQTAPDLDLELRELKAATKVKRVKLEEEIVSLTAAAEQALKDDKEEVARKRLVDRARAQAELERLLEGEAAQLAKAEEKCVKLEAKSADLYAKASKALESGDEKLARDLLQAREDVKAELEVANVERSRLAG
mmetsp:Transcript_33089/g.73764  ORF Transcript_33089/g.73764 Transcript_33089/m.73764 type:complete len:338 (+) Transcript_33089:77-1090(+)